MNMMSEDAKAILLLCGHLGGESAFEPLDQRAYNQVVQWLLGKNLRPADLLSPEHIQDLSLESGIPEQRLNGLLRRGVKLGFALEKWNQSGIWVICRSDQDYPSRYKTHLKDKAPPILFGIGERSLLKGGGLAIVGSRNVDAEGEAFARETAAWCARGGVTVVSGGARGVDQIAMTSALNTGGSVIGVLADTLLRRSVSREIRYALSAGYLLLVSPYHPEAGFNVGMAMGRNKLIYALADYGLVVSADYKQGGTWEGAEEELKRKPGRPVFVRIGNSVPTGNRKLIDLGALEFPYTDEFLNPAVLLQETAAGKVVQESKEETPLFSQLNSSGQVVHAIRETASIIETTPSRTESPISVPEATKPPEKHPVKILDNPPMALGQTESPPPLVFEVVKPLIILALDKPGTLEELAQILNVRKTQLQDWVKILLEKGVLEEQVKHKVKKLAVIKPEEELKFR
jgi:predicted Rossmann fold nucleotide-binding protein DprA/Smf involved in DNA uptake